MHRTLTLGVVLVALAVCMIGDAKVHAGGNSSWGWAKPMNKRMGAFYTSNRNANFSRSSQPRQVSTPYQHSYHYTHQTPQQTVVTHPYTAPSIAPNIIPSVTSNPVITKPAVTQPIINQAPGVVHHPPNVTDHPISTPKPQSGALPYRSSTNTFWQ